MNLSLRFPHDDQSDHRQSIEDPREEARELNEFVDVPHRDADHCKYTLKNNRSSRSHPRDVNIAKEHRHVSLPSCDVAQPRNSELQTESAAKGGQCDSQWNDEAQPRGQNSICPGDCDSRSSDHVRIGQYRHVHEIHTDVEHRYCRHSDEYTPEDVHLRLLYFFGDDSSRSPSVVGPKAAVESQSDITGRSCCSLKGILEQLCVSDGQPIDTSDDHQDTSCDLADGEDVLDSDEELDAGNVYIGHETKGEEGDEPLQTLEVFRLDFTDVVGERLDYVLGEGEDDDGGFGRTENEDEYEGTEERGQLAEVTV